MTKGPSIDERPRFSPDGRFVVFSSDRGGFIQLWKIDIAGDVDPVVVSGIEANAYSVAPEISDDAKAFADRSLSGYRSPDGRYQVRTSREDSMDASRNGAAAGIAPGQSGICEPAQFLIKDISVGSEVVLAPAGTDCGDGLMPQSAFLPDGSAFITSYGGKLWRIAVPGGEIRQIPFKARVRLQARKKSHAARRVSESELVHARRIEGAVLSPDQSRVAFTAFGRVWVKKLPDGIPHRVTASDAGEYYPVWSPDGKKLAFVSWTDESGGSGGIDVVSVDAHDRPVRLTDTSAYYSGLTYSADGSRLFAFMRPIRAVQRMRTASVFGGLEEGGDAELVSIPSGGGSPTTLDLVPEIGDPYYGTLAGPQARSSSGEPTAGEVVARYVPSKIIARVRDSEEDVGSILAVPAFATSQLLRAKGQTLLKLRLPAAAPSPWRIAEQSGINYAVLSPQGDKALVVVDFRRLFLIDVPHGVEGQAPTVLIDPTQSGVVEVTSPASGAEYPRWMPDGRSFTYVFGNRFFIGEVPDRTENSGASPIVSRSFTLDVAMPRDLPNGTLAFRHARLITMKGDEVIERGDLLIRNRRIIAIGSSDTFAIPRDATVIDLTGKTLMPGLVDLHNHVNLLHGVEQTRVWQFEANLAFGVLTSRDPQALFSTFLSYQDQLETGGLLGPRFRSTGTGIGTSRDRLDTLAEARAVMSRYADVYGVDAVKEYLLTRRDRRQRLIMAASERSLAATSHGSHLLKHLIANALDGYTGFEHALYTAPFYRDVRQLLAETGITLAHSNAPTGFEQNYLSRLDSSSKSRIARHYPSNAQSQFWAAPAGNPPLPTTSISTHRTAAALAQLVEDGVRVAVGAHGEGPGIFTHLQMWAYREGGMSALQALRAGTLRGAEAMGLGQDLGSLEIGKLADLLVLEGNPLDDIRNTSAISLIFFNGRLRDADTLDELWPGCRSLPAHWPSTAGIAAGGQSSRNCLH